jgi:hypothetical protein
MKKCKRKYCSNFHPGTFGSGQFCSRSCSNSRIRSKELKLHLSKKMKGYKFGGALLNQPRNNNVSKICLTCLQNFIVSFSKRNRKYCSMECASKRPNQGGYRPNSTRKIRSLYKGYWMDSGAERRFAELMDVNKIKWVKNTKTFYAYTDKEGKNRKYYPDFYLPTFDYWVEIKGRWYQNENDSLKLLAVGNNIELQLHNKICLPTIVKNHVSV